MLRALILAAVAAPIIAPVALASSSAPRAGGKDEVQIQTSDNVELSGTYYSPRKGRAPAVLLVHDAGKDRTQLDAFARRLQKTGFGVLTVDLRGHGESKSPKVDWERLDGSGQSSLWQLAPRDVEAAADWLLSQRDIHSTSLSLVGNGAGCALVARHAENDENVISMTLFAPKTEDFGFDVKSTIESVNGLPTCVIAKKDKETERMVSEANALTPDPWIDWIPVSSKAPTLLDDSKTASKASKWMAGIALPKKGR